MNFLLHWLDGTTSEVSGDTITIACNQAGYGAGALRALNYYEEFTLEKLFESEKAKPRNEREQLEVSGGKIKRGGRVFREFDDYNTAIAMLMRVGFVKNMEEKTFDVWMIKDI